MSTILYKLFTTFLQKIRFFPLHSDICKHFCVFLQELFSIFILLLWSVQYITQNLTVFMISGICTDTSHFQAHRYMSPIGICQKPFTTIQSGADGTSGICRRSASVFTFCSQYERLKFLSGFRPLQEKVSSYFLYAILCLFV